MLDDLFQVRARPAERWLRAWRSLSAAQLLILSFLSLIAVGTAGFLYLPGLYTGRALGLVDAVFMATSAVCVTGLTLIDVSTELTFAGQLWLLALIQAGGLGILTFAALFAAIVGRSSLAVEEAAGGPAALLPSARPAQLLRAVVWITLLCEAAGAVALFLAWSPRFGAQGAVWPAVFHAVSAFCNSGFSIFGDSLVALRDELWSLHAVALLIVVGGLGFPVIEDLRRRLRGRHERLTAHTRLVLVTTAILLAASAAVYLAFEAGNTLAELGAAGRAGNAFFMAATARTAGFHTVPYDQLSNPGLLLTLGLMWVGGGPASVAGGVKITTFALLWLMLFSRLRGDRHVSVGGRTVPGETVQRAAGLAVGAFLLLAAFTFVLLATEPAAGGATDRMHLVRLVFELQSALGTVGLSMGLTSELTPVGRLVVAAVMLLGRIGPLVVVGAMALRQRRRTPFRYAHEDVLVG